MLKIDEKIVDEFLGTRDVGNLYTPHKCMRIYWSKDDTILILTPMLQDDDEALNTFLKAYRISNQPLKVSGKYKRGRFLVYTFEKDCSDYT